jgi:alanyl-tRNA synthetase
MIKYFSASEIRHTWLRFFKDKGHAIEESSSLIPKDDKTLLWINAGVAPLKKYFDSSEIPQDKRIVNVQKCIRTNDIDNVGRTARHHTFFEMMGNFSIGDYFKLEAIEYALELLTSEAYFGMPLEKLYMTYYTEDEITKNKWLSLGIQSDHLIPLDGNFWEIGPGPCGPDTEIFFDRGESFDARGIELLQNDVSNDRYIEIWNVVFSQFNAKEGLNRSDYPELPQRNIDTGAGLERFASVLQQTQTNFETDLFFPVIKHIETLSGHTYQGQMAFKVIADHIKALTFAISDGAMLSNEGRGYVLRRLLRRAVKYGLKLSFESPFLFEFVPTVIDMMKDFYPDLIKNADIVSKIIKKEEEKFFETIRDGEKLLEEVLSQTDKVLSGDIVFKLYDTYGFPFELTEEYAEEKGVSVDSEGFKRALEEQKERSRSRMKSMNHMNEQEQSLLSFHLPSKFIGYDTLTSESKVIAIFEHGIVLDQTPFYALSGGQMSDQGLIGGIEVKEVIKLPNKQHLHIVDSTLFEIGQVVICDVYQSSRKRIEQNHSAAHLFHQAVKEVIGSHANQQGQYVSDLSWRFDFNHYDHITDEIILSIESKVNHYIQTKPLDVNIYETTISKAKEKGAMALFGEKYGDVVRVVDMGWSIELCGGTHVKNTKEIVLFAITQVSSIGSGIIRMEGITGKDISTEIQTYIEPYLLEIHNLKEKIAQQSLDIDVIKPNITGSYQDIITFRAFISDLKGHIKTKEKLKLDLLEKDVLSYVNLNELKADARIYKIKTKDVPAKVFKALADQLFDYLKAETLLLLNEDDVKISYICKSHTIDCSKVVKELANLTQGSGGGKENFAQGGALKHKDIDHILKDLKL